MTADATTALSDLQRQYFIQEISGLAAQAIEEAANAVNLATLATNSANLATIVTNTANIADVEVNTNSLVAGLVSLIANTAPGLADNIDTATTTLVKSGAGTLLSVIVNSVGTVASTVTVYDGIDATGTLLAIIDSLTETGSYDYKIALTVGLCVVTTGTVAPNITVVYR